MHALSSRLLLGAALLPFLFPLQGCGARTGSAGIPATVDQAAIAAYRAKVLPAADERRWEEMDWIATYADGLRASSDRQKPLLLYVMNGHPLGCT
jgi:hypothetical protein